MISVEPDGEEMGLKQYTRDGEIPQACCDGNAPHKIIGIYVEQQVPLKDADIPKALKENDLEALADV